MKKVLQLWILLFAIGTLNAKIKAQTSQLCQTGCNPIPVMGEGMFFGVNVVAFPDNYYSGVASRGRIAWVDPDANGACAYNVNKNPAYDSYVIEIYVDGSLVVNVPNWTWKADDGISASYGFNYWFPISPGHTYSGRVGKNCKTGNIIAWSPTVTFSTAAVPAKVPAGVNTLGGQAPKKHGKN